jgi:hypothetical protein
MPLDGHSRDRAAAGAESLDVFPSLVSESFPFTLNTFSAPNLTLARPLLHSQQVSSL